MRKHQKEAINNFLNTLSQAQNEIQMAIEKKNIPGALALLEQCQQGAIELGTFIEREEGEGFSTITLLEEYCEQIYQIYEELSHTPAPTPQKIKKILQKKLAQLQNSVNTDIKPRIEAVFLPYKASMWDSLESIWQAANEDPDCDAYVIPIPYYDKGADGSFETLHYELDQYPSYVPVLQYTKYDFEKRKPDFIFIHNPYDDCNYVTSVHPFFYSENLKRFTDHLVYVPYFILHEISPDNEKAIASIEHFCTVPGVLNADKVFVQSEDMRRVYIKVITTAIKGTPLNKKQWEQKILGTGSPKLDKVTSTKTDNLKIPALWLKMIQKPDGTRKKIILYNTSVTALLKYEEKMLEKMKNVFRIFHEHSKESVLLWRPHPLIQATIESMRPALWREYEELVQMYQKKSIGIYDDSPDMNRALAISDAYYGDGSSLVQLYKQLGKPIMLQNVEIIKPFQEDNVL